MANYFTMYHAGDWYKLWTANNGNPAANALLKKLFAARALAAYDG
jgi:hypothetical protein